MQIISHIPEMQHWSEAKRLEGKKIAFVPTMGFLHEGHLSLVREGKRRGDVVVVSIFVNPIQFNQRADFATYPRNLEQDCCLLEEVGTDALFSPEAPEMYPEGFQTAVEVDNVSRPLCGAFRPGHFRGVATVVLKLFSVVRPDRAYFGQKDAQQVAVVKQMVRDLDLDLEIRVMPTVRDPDGLALSSRNAYLSPEQRQRALALPRALATRDPARARELLAGLDIDYLEVADFNPPVLAAAVRIDGTRLIDNAVLDHGVACDAASEVVPTRAARPIDPGGEGAKRSGPPVPDSKGTR